MKSKMNSENESVTILIAEDSKTQAEQLKYLLEKQNYNVIVAKDGKEALEVILKVKPSLVVSDIVMPEMNGYQLCKEIKSSQSTLDIPVILLTSLSRSEDVLEGISCGADNFITKPYREDYLISHIEQILANRKIYKNERVRVGVEILFGGKRRFITSSQQQMLSLLVSTYEAAVQRNDELVQTQDELKKLNERLEEIVAERTTELSAEIEIRKSAEEKIIKLNRVYAVLSNINQAIVRIHDTKQLLNKACLIAIDEGKFQSAWIGIVNSETKKIETAATAGFANGLFEVNQKQNPIINAIKSGKCLFSNNIDADDDIAEIWKQHASSLGFKSFIVFPLNVIGKVIGGYCIYSNEIDFFDELEINLLDEMSTDISFALEYIQKEFERKRAEEALLKLKKAVDNSGEIIFLTDKEGIFTFVNPAFTYIYGFTADEIVGKVTPRILKSGTEDANFYKNFWETLQDRKEKRGELINKRKDGTLINVDVSATPIFDESKNIIGFLGIQRDITERKHAEKVMREYAEQYRTMISSTLFGFWLVDEKGKLLDVNDTYCSVSGYTREELLNLSVPDIEVIDKPEDVAARIQRIIQSGTDQFESKHKTKDGVAFDVEISLSFLNSVKQFVVFIRDITERKQAEKELIEAKEKAEEMSHLKSNFLANMSHELRTPLNGILGYAEILNSLLNDPEQIQISEGIYQSGKRLSETLKSILDLSDAETDKFEVVSKTIEVIPVIKNCFNSFSVEAARKNIFLESVVEGENIYGNLDENLFTRIILNLLNNALKFTNKGKISVETGKEITDSKEWFYIKIKDTGIGIPSNKIDLIWEEFRQVSEGLSRTFEGPGLGLTIAKKATILMHGEISVESELGVGSIFTVKFPTVKIPSTNEVFPKEKKAAIPSDKEKVVIPVLPLALYVEDDTVNQHIVRLFLKNICIVEAAEDAKTALQMVVEKNYDFILMDINLGGGMNGMDVVSELNKMPQYKNTPIIAVTAYAMEKDKAEFLKGGCTHYIAKPFNKNDIVDLVKNAIGNRK